MSMMVGCTGALRSAAISPAGPGGTLVPRRPILRTVTTMVKQNLRGRRSAVDHGLGQLTRLHRVVAGGGLIRRNSIISAPVGEFITAAVQMNLDAAELTIQHFGGRNIADGVIA